MSDLNRLKIKTNVVNRTMKDTASYSKEIVEEKAKIEKMKTEGAEEHDIKQMVLNPFPKSVRTKYIFYLRKVA